MSGQERRVVGQDRSAARLDPGAGRRQGHLPEAVVVAVALPVRRDVNQLGVRRLVESRQEARRQGIARAEQPLEGDPVGDRPVVEEQGERPALAHVAAIGAARIERDGPGPPVPAGLAHARGLAGRQDGEPHALLGEHRERVLVHGRLGQPHPGGLAPEPVTEVGQPPSHLGDLVAAARERQDRVAVGLRDGVAASAGRPARPVRRQDRGIDVGALRSSHAMSVGPTSKARAAKLSTTSRIRFRASTRRAAVFGA